MVQEERVLTQWSNILGNVAVDEAQVRGNCELATRLEKGDGTVWGLLVDKKVAVWAPRMRMPLRDYSPL